MTGGRAGAGARRWLPILALGLTAGIAGLGLGYVVSRKAAVSPAEQREATPAEVTVGDLVPDFELADLEGHEVAFSQLAGRPVLVNFWATWCPPCLREMPLLQAWHEEDRIQVLGIDAGEPIGVVKAYLESNDIDYPVWIDPPAAHPPGRATMDLFRQFGGIGLPLTLFVDAEGMLRAAHNGELDESILRTNVAKVMAPR